MIDHILRGLARGVEWFGFLSRIVLILLLVWIVIGSFAIGFSVLGGFVRLGLVLLLTFWLARPSHKYYPIWAIASGLIGLSFVTAPCWFEFPAQDGGPQFHEQITIAELRNIQEAENDYFARFRRYGDLVEIAPKYIHPYSRTQAIAATGRITLSLVPNGYHLTANAASNSGSYACCIGCPRYRNFYGDESAVLRANSHCKPATSSSPIVK